MSLPVSEPSFPTWSGIYDPDMGSIGESAYLEAIQAATAPVIGILVNAEHMHSNNLEHVDCLIRAVRSKWALPLCVFSEVLPNEAIGCEGIKSAMQRYMLSGGKPVVGAIINTLGHSLSIVTSPGDGSRPQETSVFEAFGVPVFQLMTTLQTCEDWSESVKGIDSLSLSWSVFQPEFDGQIITFPYATTEYEPTELGPKKHTKPIVDRVDKIAATAINWAKLRLMDNSEKKVAVILHNNPPRNDNIGGAAGLDTPESLWGMLRRFEEIGITTTTSFQDGKEIIDAIINGLTNDGRWMPPEAMLEKSVDTVSKEIYMNWHQEFSPRVQESLANYWGDPVGDFMAVNDEILIPGILN